MIEPTNGRVVWFTPAVDEPVICQHDFTKPLAALVTHVWGERMVNLTVFDSNGETHAVTSVNLLQDDDRASELGRYCEWMPFQKGQAAKAEQPAQPVDHESIVERVFERIRAKLAGHD